MDTPFNIFEVLRIAEEIEAKIARFYLRAAERFSDEKRRGICYHLVGWRTRHRDHWQRMRHQYSAQTGEFGAFDPDNYVRSNPQTMADLTEFGTRLNNYRWPSGYETEEQLLHDAIRRSQGLIVFYHGLKEFTHGTESHTMIENMIRQEDRHICLLSRMLAQPEPLTNDSSNHTYVCPAEMETLL